MKFPVTFALGKLSLRRCLSSCSRKVNSYLTSAKSQSRFLYCVSHSHPGLLTVLDKGVCELMTHQGKKKVVKRGYIIGMMGVMYNQPRIATYKALEDC